MFIYKSSVSGNVFLRMTFFLFILFKVNDFLFIGIEFVIKASCVFSFQCFFGGDIVW